MNRYCSTIVTAVKPFQIIFSINCLFVSSQSVALGNHPESSNCPSEKPYYAICTHSLHNLEGWYGGCHTTRALAQITADEHAKKEHAGNSRWTGVLKAKVNHPTE